MKRLILCTAITLIVGLSAAYAEKAPHVVGRMKVSIMPEYDTQGVLVVQEGKFDDKTAFPDKVRFNLPPGVTKLTDVCSLSPGGQHFCQLYDIASEGDRTFVDVGLPYSDFFIDFQYTPFEAKEHSDRSFSYDVESPYDIKTLEVHVQQPFRSENFAIVPAGGETYEKKDFEYRKYIFKDVKAGERKTFTVNYHKMDAQPSVDIKYSRMSGMAGSHFFHKNSGELVLVGGILLLAAIWVLKRRKAKPSDNA